MEPEILDLKDQLDQAQRDAQGLFANLTAEQGVWRIADGSWSIAQCLDHLARTNENYLQAMQSAADCARREGRVRRRPALPGLLGRRIARTLEPPVKAYLRLKTFRTLEPPQIAGLKVAVKRFTLSQNQVRAFLEQQRDLDLASITFANPFVGGLRFTLATGLSIITAHERRHLWQAWQVRRAMEEVGA